VTRLVTVTVAVHVVLALATFGNVTHIRICFICVILAKVAKETTITESFGSNTCKNSTMLCNISVKFYF
jgi:hypothetical protein